jgi:hypothetical protein
VSDGERFLREALASVNQAILQQNWLGALALALTLPDICGKVAHPGMSGSQARYEAWFGQWLARPFGCTGRPDPDDPSLCGADMYALRCAFLHEGRDDITSQRARDLLTRFIFVAPAPGRIVHMNRLGTALQLQVDLFCMTVCGAVERWLESVQTDAAALGALGNHLRIWHL